VSHLDRLTPLLGIVARERTASRPDLFDDVRQEAMIRAWEVERDRPDAPREYVLAAAKRGANDVLRGRPGFGERGRRGWSDAHGHAGPLQVDEETQEDTLGHLEDLGAQARLQVAEIAAERSDVLAALRDLDEADRLVVFWRFWEGLTWPEIGARVGRSANAVRVRFEKHLAPALRDRLAHLQEVVA
jgi:RNA polymerase sigma factor (sigma-70 family)